MKITKQEITALLADPASRETILAALSDQLSGRLVRVNDGLRFLVADKLTGNIVDGLPVNDLLVQSLVDGTIARNTTEGKTVKEELALARDAFLRLADVVSRFMVDTDLAGEQLPTRSQIVEDITDVELASVG